MIHVPPEAHLKNLFAPIWDISKMPHEMEVLFGNTNYVKIKSYEHIQKYECKLELELVS